MELLKTINGRTYYSSNYFMDRMEIATRKLADMTEQEHIDKIAKLHKVSALELYDAWRRHQRQEAERVMATEEFEREWIEWEGNH